MKAFRKNILEEEIKNRIGKEFFSHFDYQSIIGKIDFAVMERLTKDEEVEDDERIFYLWAEAKKEDVKIDIMIAQLILTIGRAKTFNDFLPPKYIGAFDAKKMAFVPYSEILHFFTMNDFDWTVTPSDHSTKEFQMVLERVRGIVDKGFVFFYETDEKLLKQFIKDNFNGAKSLNKIQVDKNNFVNIYQKWLLQVKDSINVNNWDLLKSKGIIDGDFFLADLLSEEDRSIKDTLLVVLQHDKYKVMKEADPDFGNIYFDMHFFRKKAYNQFWSKYERPPQKEYWDYMIERRDLLVPQDVRERNGSFFTPSIWVEKSQEYLADYLGENWQDEYYIWDCAAGTGNLLAGLTNKYNIFASTLDLADVEVMKDRVDYMNEMSSNGNGSNLLKEHIFQFDFLNDDFDSPKVPKALQDILNDDNKRRKLIIYINPPYAEVGIVRGNLNRRGFQFTKVYNNYKVDLGKAGRELFAQFFIRIYKEISNCVLAEFSTLKILQAPNFSVFRINFQAKLEKLFLVPANTFDNVKGQFPIGFFIWNLSKKEKFEKFENAKFFDKNNQLFLSKNLYSYDDDSLINSWMNTIINDNNKEKIIGYINIKSSDFQNNNRLVIGHKDILSRGNIHRNIYKINLIYICLYYSSRHCIKSEWHNDREQFLYPNEGWEDDRDFQADCLAFTLFHGQNRIKSSEGENHWIPFIEKEVNAPTLFASHFMSDYIRDFLAGKIESKKREETDISFDEDEMDANSNAKAIKFSEEASAVMEAGREIWAYYMKQKNINVNASFYDIRAYFQGRNEKGEMNSRSNDETYTELLGKLRSAQKILAKRIEEKVYKYGFLNK